MNRIFLLFLITLLCASSSTARRTGTVYIDHNVSSSNGRLRDGATKFVEGVYDSSGLVYASYEQTINETGWNILNVKAGYNPDVSNDIIMYQAGYIEGVLTANDIFDFYSNWYSIYSSYVPEYKAWMNEQENWAREMIMKFAGTDTFWKEMSYIFARLDGMIDGYNSVADESMPEVVLLILNAYGDEIDLDTAWDEGFAVPPDDSSSSEETTTASSEESKKEEFSKKLTMSRQEYLRYRLQNNGFKGRPPTRCSAVIKVSPGYENIYIGHSTWDYYQTMNRIYKHYDIQLETDYVRSNAVSFPSYPGLIHSVDDFYVVDSGLVVMETTYDVFNYSVYEMLTPASAFSYQRLIISNAIATDGESWTTTFSQYNSGTYNNQWMVVDLNKFTPGKELGSGLFWIFEQLPDYYVAQEMTHVLQYSYWPSYNIPATKSVYEMSGNAYYAAIEGPSQSYELYSRAEIMRRDNGLITSLDGIQRFLRYNNYEVDEYSSGDPCDSICCRYDLDESSPMPFGCLDTKVTDYKSALNMTAYAVSGPTTNYGLLPTFSWDSDEMSQYSHLGMPDTWDYEFETMTPMIKP